MLDNAAMAFPQKNYLDHEGSHKMVHLAIDELYCCYKQSTSNSNVASQIFICVTEKFNEVQEALDFSISYEIQKMQEDMQRSFIFGEINPDLTNSKVFVIMPFKDAFKQIYEDHIKKFVTS